MTDLSDDSEPTEDANVSAQSSRGSEWLSAYLNSDPRFSEGLSEEQPEDVSFGLELPGRLRSRPFRKDEHDAITRRWLAFVVLGVVAVLYGAAVLGLLAGWIDSAELGRVALVLGPIQALAAAVLGFYFGQDKGR